MKKAWLVFSVMLVLLLTACSSNSGSGVSSEETSISDKSVVGEVTPIYEDDVISVSYEGLSEVDGIDATYINLNIVNHEDQQITVYMKDGYVNTLTVNVGSGIPMTIEAGKEAHNAFILMHGTSGDFPALNDITEVGFKLWVVDENTSTLLETNTIVVTP